MDSTLVELMTAIERIPGLDQETRVRARELQFFFTWGVMLHEPR